MDDGFKLKLNSKGVYVCVWKCFGLCDSVCVLCCGVALQVYCDFVFK